MRPYGFLSNQTRVITTTSEQIIMLYLTVNAALSNVMSIDVLACAADFTDAFCDAVLAALSPLRSISGAIWFLGRFGVAL